jgi:hypothetical protein
LPIAVVSELKGAVALLIDGVADARAQPSDGPYKLFEGRAYPPVSGFVSADLVVAATQVLDEGAPDGYGLRRSESLSSAHRPQRALSLL